MYAARSLFVLVCGRITLFDEGNNFTSRHYRHILTFMKMYRIFTLSLSLILIASVLT